MKRSEANERHNEDNAFQRFEDLTKRLLAIPKKEADAKMKEIEDRKSKKPR